VDGRAHRVLAVLIRGVRDRGLRRLGLLAAFQVVFCPAALAVPSSECAQCHDTEATTFAKSVHSFLECQDCHTGITAIPHSSKLPLVNCASCHDAVAAVYTEHGGAKESPGHYFPACWDCHGKHDIMPGNDPSSRVAPRNLARTCGSCHENPSIVAQHHIPMIGPVEVFEKSVHARVPHGEKRPAATCVDCHSATGTGHRILPPIDPQSTIFHFNIPKTCAKCHEKIGDRYSRSSHGWLAAHGEADAPVCTTCHGEHAILPVTDKESPVYPTNVSLTTCGPCHGSKLINQKYGMPQTIMESWEHSYHGLKSTDGDVDVANCSSCHRAHLVLPASDPKSSVNPANLMTTCGQCHHGISEAVVHIPIHAETGIALNDLGQLLRRIYIVAIAVIIGLMVLHWIIDLQKRIRVMNKGPQVVRMQRDELWQHTFLMVSFTVLAITGFAFQFSGVWWARMLFGWKGGFVLRHTVHRVAAVVFMGTAIWHLIYLGRRRGRRFIRDIFPALLDFRQFGQMIAHNLGKRPEEPRFRRFSYIEKAEYWALVWGTVVMTGTGLALWFGNVTEKALEVQALGIMLVVHYYEAILAGLAIVVWHFYSTIFNPPVYPNNPSWYTGSMPVDMYRREHPDDPALAAAAAAASRSEAPAPAGAEGEARETAPEGGEAPTGGEAGGGEGAPAKPRAEPGDSGDEEAQSEGEPPESPPPPDAT
jgi:cytochrome b subunit of formate dehydrogenase